MAEQSLRYSLPRWRLTRWLADPGSPAPDDIRAALIASLFGTLPIYVGGVLNTIAVAAIITWRIPTPLFICWLTVETAICVVRFAVLVSARRRAQARRSTPTDLFILLGVAWSASVGFGAFAALLSGDWVAATLACMSAAGMAGGTCFRNFGAPRLSAAMTSASLGPICLAAPFAGEPAMFVAFAQMPLYVVSMRMAAYRLNALLVSTMLSEREHVRRAREDPLTGLSNRSGLSRAMEAAGDRSVALLYLDLDGFKAVNDAHGHAAGDRLLQQAAERLRGLLRGDDVAARIGGDEFVVIARDVTTRHAPAFGERLIRELSRPYDLDGRHEVAIGVSVGVALTPDHGEALPDLLDVADAALYAAKKRGKSCCVIAAPSARNRRAAAAAEAR